MANTIGTLISERSRTAAARPRRGIQAAAAKQTEIVHHPGSYGPPDTQVPWAALIR